MLNGMYAAAAGMAAHQAWLDALADDIANVNTTGYHAQRMDIRDLSYGESQGQAVGSGAGAYRIGVSGSQGALLPGSGPLSVAIQGPGYFQIRRADGSLALTRSGDFRLDAGGSIVLASGERLEPPITVPKGTSADSISIAADGTVTAGTKKIGQIVVVDVPAPSGLIALGDGQFSPTASSGAPAPAGARIEQGMLEASDVDLAEAMVGVIQAQKGFDLSARALRNEDQLMEIVNGIRR
jgi:flagellar basal-body rod protein FlgG